MSLQTPSPSRRGDTVRPHLALVLAVLVLAPLGALAWLGVRMTEGEARAVQTRFDGVIGARLDETAAAVERVVAGLESDVLAATESLPATPDLLRRRLREGRRLGQLLLFDTEGRLTFPPPEGPVSADERAFLERTRGLWENRDFARPPAGDSAADGGVLPGWSIWYWAGGLNLMYRRPLPDGRTVAVEVDRPQLLSAVIGALPSTDGSGGEGTERLTLLDSSGRIVYQWGVWEPPPSLLPRLERPLPPPLEAWRLAWSGPSPPPPSMSGLYAGLAAVALALLGLAVWFYRASTAELRRAARRVSFVNQVSHELKTPLTNIRMYAELLDDALWDADDRTRRHLGVIVDESQRLSRLIGNILTFARHQRDRLTLRPVPHVLDELVEGVLEQFAPAFASKGIVVSAALDAPDTAQLDADAVGQILANLLGNVEKYAADGGRVEVSTRQDDTGVWLTVSDAGPGIGRGHQNRIFEPFYRISDKLSDGVAGTGIGLGIARALARLHGGDLTLEPSDVGARFTARLAAPRASCEDVRLDEPRRVGEEIP